MPLPRALDVTTSVLASQLRAWRGTAAFKPARRQPQALLEIYEFEGCPYCRLLREALTELDLDARIYPCPARGSRFRPRVRELGGKFQFPYLIDPNTGTALYESADIIAYLAETYDGRVPPAHALRRTAQVVSSQAASLVRGLRGMRARASQAPAQPLELYSFESSPYSRLVRETLCELELPYVLRNLGKGRWEDMGPPGIRKRFFADTPVEGRNRQRLLALAGRVQAPYLIDANTGTALFESAAIIRYLEAQYAA